MTEIERMKDSINSFDVFEFKNEDELAEMTVKKCAPESGYPNALGVSATEIEFATAECCSSPGASVRVEDDIKVALQQPLCNDRSDAYEILSERSSSGIAKNNASSDGPSSDNCYSDWDLGDERVGIVFYPDYTDYCGTHYLDSVVKFSRSFVEARSKTMCGNERTFRIHLEIEDIVRIESKWSARDEAGIINIHFISKDGVQDNIIYNASGRSVGLHVWFLILLLINGSSYPLCCLVSTASQLQVLKFPVVDSNWYQKQEAIGSLDVRYKALWNV